MNIFWCHEKNENYGLFVKASTRGRAKAIFSAEIECDITDVRTNIMRRGINEHFDGVIDLGDPILKRCGLEYSEDEDYDR